jgi:hypothetical protein
VNWLRGKYREISSCGMTSVHLVFEADTVKNISVHMKIFSMSEHPAGLVSAIFAGEGASEMLIRWSREGGMDATLGMTSNSYYDPCWKSIPACY